MRDIYHIPMMVPLGEGGGGGRGSRVQTKDLVILLFFNWRSSCRKKECGLL